MAICFYSHVNYSVTKIGCQRWIGGSGFYSHVNYSVTKIKGPAKQPGLTFYSHVNYSVTKIYLKDNIPKCSFTVT